MGKTIAHLLGLVIPNHGTLVGRILGEAMPNGLMPDVVHEAVRSEPDALGRRTVVLNHKVGDMRYFDAAGYPGRTLSLPAETP